jgi:hypothetical protein
VYQREEKRKRLISTQVVGGKAISVGELCFSANFMIFIGFREIWDLERLNGFACFKWGKSVGKFKS